MEVEFHALLLATGSIQMCLQRVLKCHVPKLCWKTSESGQNNDKKYFFQNYYENMFNSFYVKFSNSNFRVIQIKIMLLGTESLCLNLSHSLFIVVLLLRNLFSGSRV